MVSPLYESVNAVANDFYTRMVYHNRCKEPILYSLSKQFHGHLQKTIIALEILAIQITTSSGILFHRFTIL